MVLNKNLYLLGLILILAGAGKLYSMHRDIVEDAKKQVIAQYNEQYVDDLEDKIQRLSLVVSDQFKNLQTKDDEIKAIRDKHTSLLNSVSKRPTREEQSSSNNSNPGNTSSCTGAELSREDAEFLAGEASRAQAVVAERDYYYKQYRDLRIRLTN